MMKIAFFWTQNFSKNILAWIFKDLEVALVISQPDKKVGRKQEFEETPIKIFAEENNLRFLQPTKLKDNFEFFNELKVLNLDFIVVVAYWKIIPKEILEIPKFGCINIHGSILPKYRWASPVQEALKNWDKKTGLTIMEMTEWMDEWDILQMQEIEIWQNDKTPDIFKKFEEIWPNLLLKTLNWIIDWKIKWIPQNDAEATYCKKIEKKDGQIDFVNETAIEIYNKFRAYYIWPWIYTFYKGKKFDIVECYPSISQPLSQIPMSSTGMTFGRKGEVMKLENWEIWVVCKKWILVLKKVKLEGKKEMEIKDFVNGDREFLKQVFLS
jgi:methionyl-tRNA formyltransferase